MADLMGPGGIAAGSGSNGKASFRQPTTGPAPTSSPSGIRGPRMIMQERALREAARQRAEAEKQQMERERVEQEARAIEEARRRNAERRAAGVAAGQGSSAQASVGSQPQSQAVPENLPNAQPVRAQVPTEMPQQRPPRANLSQGQAFTSTAPPRHPQPPPSQRQQQPAPDSQPTDTSPPAAVTAKPRNSFPHAFERWETLSAHWEGLTSYWIRKLEQNKDEINQDPVSQQLARQVTDLSAAGANLFHAVVELQRLRASSERKFQRWFFETRAELERAQEVNAMMETAIQQERRNRETAIRDAVDHERGNSKAQKQLAEMRKELAISKEEARRAWEELGRRENEERERTLSLQSGQPTSVGGVQVVPMTQGGASRQASTREPAEQQPEYSRPPQEPVPSQAVPATQATAAPNPESYYRSHQPQPEPTHQGGGSEDGYSDAEYVIDATGNFARDSQGNKILFAAPHSAYSGSDMGAEDYETPVTTNPPSGSHEPPSTSAPAEWTGNYSNPQDYSGQGYGRPSWDAEVRHHHPTRLSDVIEEEDERSRTSASQVSRG